MKQSAISKQYKFGNKTVDFTPSKVIVREKTLKGPYEAVYDLHEIDPNYTTTWHIPVMRMFFTFCYLALCFYVILFSDQPMLASSYFFMAMGVPIGIYGIKQNWQSTATFRNSYKSGESFSLPYGKQHQAALNDFVETLDKLRCRMLPPLPFIPDLLAHYGVIGRKEYLSLKERIAIGARLDVIDKGVLKSQATVVPFKLVEEVEEEVDG